MDMDLVQGMAPQRMLVELPEGWTSTTFTVYNEAYEFAMDRGWAAKPQRVQMRQVNGEYIVERFDGSGCGCGG